MNLHLTYATSGLLRVSKFNQQKAKCISDLIFDVTFFDVVKYLK
jgi:hypothetical protein